MNNKNLPNFFIVGAPRCGTTALQKILSSHPDVFMSPIKEPHYFSTDFKIENFALDYREKSLCDLTSYLEQPVLKELHLAHTPNYHQYIQLYREVKVHKAIGEASSGYLYSSEAAQNIQKSNPNARIIMILRNPVDRAYSHYIMDKASGRVLENSFAKAVKNDYSNPSKAWGEKHLYVELGMYYEQVCRYQEMFPKNQIKTILYDDWIRDNEKILVEVCNFLEIPIASFPEAKMTFNRSNKPRFHYAHYFLSKTKLRQIQGSLLPKTIRSIFKMVWYTQSIPKGPSSQEKFFVSSHFNDDIKRLRLLLNNQDLWL